MRVAAWTAGVAWFLICASLSYARFARHTAPAVVVQHGAVSPPPTGLEPAAAPANAPIEKTEPENPAWDRSLDSAPERVDAPAPSVAVPAPSAPTLPAAPVSPSSPAQTLIPPPVVPPVAKGAEPAPSRKPRTRKDGAPKTAETKSPEAPTGSAAVEPAARCLECGAPAASWVEVDGQRVGYCRKHYSRLDRPRGSRKRAAAHTPEPATPPDAGNTSGIVQEPAPAQQEPAGDAAPSVQCRGFTKDGTRCRRKTRDPSGFCYQHRPR